MVKQQVIATIVLGLIVFSTGWAQSTSPSVIATPPQPAWSELTVPQKLVLAPLSDEWDSLEAYRQKKWLGIATRFQSLSPEEQRRLQGQMQEWRRLTPEERQIAREKYKTTASKLSADQKQELKQKWEEYLNLPAEEREKLKQQAANQTPTQHPLLPGDPSKGSAPTATLPALPEGNRAAPLPAPSQPL